MTLGERKATMITAPTTAGSESTKPTPAREERWPRVDSLPQSTEPVRLANPFPLAARHPANSTPIGRSVATGSTPTGTILNFPRAPNDRSTSQSYEASWNENHNLTFIDILVISGLFLTAVLFYPAMAWIVFVS